MRKIMIIKIRKREMNFVKNLPPISIKQLK